LSKNVSDYLVEILEDAGVPDYITNKTKNRDKNVYDYLVEMLVKAGVKPIYASTRDSLKPVN